jgi:hypothetical protein
MATDNLFTDTLNSILRTKKEIHFEDHNKEYPAWTVNRVLSNYTDCILYTNMMNINFQLDKKLQYQYLLNTVRSMKRPYNKAAKVMTDKDLVCVKEYFGYSNEKAKEALRILTDEQIAFIKEKQDRGGVRK